MTVQASAFDDLLKDPLFREEFEGRVTEATSRAMAVLDEVGAREETVQGFWSLVEPWLRKLIREELGAADLRRSGAECVGGAERAQEKP